MKKKLLFPMTFAVLLMTVSPVWSQNQGQSDEILLFVGLKLDDLMMRYGIPQSVHAARGGEVWQDDVVFIYNEGDFYIFRDRVWQIGLRSVYGMRIGDARAVVQRVLGEGVQDRGDYILYRIPGSAWPLSLRINISADRISGIFVFREDF
ncbi:MAG: hypothetical protein FWG89_05570 [Treponema sp.]|nr:hypothetical protein [Treponema sp.]